MTKKIAAIIQARIGSSRLPGKVLLEIQNKPILHYVVNQVRESQYINDIIIATTDNLEDEKIVKYCEKHNLKYFRGSSFDLLDRYYQCAKKFDCELIVRITSDCPLIDPKVIDLVIEKFLKNSYDYVSNNIEYINNRWENATCNFPQGMTVEISTFNTLKKAWEEAKKPSEREHVFPYVQFNETLFKIANVIHDVDLAHIRCTIDRIEDFNFLKEIFDRLPDKIIHIEDIVRIVKENPDILKINNEISFDEGYQKSLVEDKKSGY